MTSQDDRAELTVVDLAGTENPNDSAILKLFQVTGVEPMFAPGPHGRYLTAVAVTVYIGSDVWPLDVFRSGAVIQWAAQKFGVSRERVVLKGMP